MTPPVTCPKCNYVRSDQDDHVHADVCPACGIAYSKFLARAAGAPPTRLRLEAADEEDDEPVDIAVFYGRVVTWLGLTVWGGSFIAGGIDWESIMGSFMHNIDLPFHEFGHVLFMPFGRFMHILGGSLFQVMLPLGLGIAFLILRGDRFAASVMLWWTGQSLIDLSPYIADAKNRYLPLIGGLSEDFHDWGNLLTMLNALEKTEKIAKTSFGLGSLLIIAAAIWGLAVLLKQRRRLV